MGQLTWGAVQGKFRHCARLHPRSSSLCSPHRSLGLCHCLNLSRFALPASAVWLFDYCLALGQTTGELTSQWLNLSHDYNGFILVGPLLMGPLVLECSVIVMRYQPHRNNHAKRVGWDMPDKWSWLFGQHILIFHSVVKGRVCGKKREETGHCRAPTVC